MDLWKFPLTLSLFFNTKLNWNYWYANTHSLSLRICWRLSLQQTFVWCVHTLFYCLSSVCVKYILTLWTGWYWCSLPSECWHPLHQSCCNSDIPPYPRCFYPLKVLRKTQASFRLKHTDAPVTETNTNTPHVVFIYVSSNPVVYIQTFALSSVLYGFLLVNVCLCSLRCSLCVLHFRLCLSVSGEADRQVPPVVKNIYSLTHTQSHAHFPKVPRLLSPEAPPSCASRAAFTFSALHTGFLSFPVMEFSVFCFIPVVSCSWWHKAKHQVWWTQICIWILKYI